VELIKRLVGVSWVVSFKALRTSYFALPFSPTEHCAPVWCCSAHTQHIDAPINESMRVITGCLRSTPTSFLPILSGITPPETGGVLHAWNFTLKPSIRYISYTKRFTLNLLLNLSAP